MLKDKLSLKDEELDQVTGGTILHYRVQPGDSLDAIAARFHVSKEQLMKWNNIVDPTVLSSTQTLNIKY